MKNILFFLKQMHSYSGLTLYTNLISMTFIGLLQGVSILLLIFMINISGLISTDIPTNNYLNIFGLLKNIPTFFSLPLILTIFVIVSIAISYLTKKIMIKNTIIHNSFLKQLRLETYNALLHSSWSYFIKNRKSDLINVMLTEINKASNGTRAILNFLSSLITTFFQILLAFLLSPNITVFLLISGVILIFFNRRFLKNSHRLATRNFELGREYLAGITDHINGIKEVKSNSLESSQLSWFKSITDQMEEEQNAFNKLKANSQFYFKCSSSILISVLIYVLIQLFHSQSTQLMIIIVIFSRLWPRISNIQSSLETIAASIPSFNIVKNFQQECKALVELDQKNLQNVKPLLFQKTLECKNIYFSYNTNENKVTLRDINITIPVNKTTAFIGKSGAGKSTLIDLIMGLNIPQTGQILIDGTPLTRDNILPLREILSYVPQDPFLFSTTIKENLLLVNKSATEEELWSALTFASADDFVKQLPNGLNTEIGDRGVRLSGGERQRIVLARAILRKPKILILDEATSALDTISEAKIQESLESLKGKMTIIVIAHRISTISNADHIIVLNDGKVVEQGSYKELEDEQNSFFINLLNSKLSNSIESLL